MTRRRFHRRIYLGILRQQRLICACGCGIKISRAEGYQFDHSHALVFDGPDAPENLRALRRPCHARKSARDVKANAKVKRLIKKQAGTWHQNRQKMPSRPFPTKLRKRMDGKVEPR